MSIFNHSLVLAFCCCEQHRDSCLCTSDLHPGALIAFRQILRNGFVALNHRHELCFTDVIRSRESIGDCFYSASQQASGIVTSSKFLGQSIRWSSISIVSLNFEILMTWSIFSWLLIIQICSSWVVRLLFRNCRILLPISLNHIIFNYLDVLSLLLLTPDNVSSLFSLLFLSSFFSFFDPAIWCPCGRTQITVSKAHLFLTSFHMVWIL